MTAESAPPFTTMTVRPFVCQRRVTPTRRQITALLADRDLTVNEIASTFELTRPAISKHLRVLRDTGLVTERRVGREHLQCFNGAGLEPLADWLKTYGEFWDRKLAKLTLMLEEQ